MDFAARIVAIATHLLPADRRDWGAAMKAELAQVHGARGRLRFALGCARAALFAPRRPESTVGSATVAIMLAGVAACIAMTWYTIARYPIAARGLSLVRFVFFALVLVGYCWIALRPPRGLAPSRRLVQLGTVLGLAFYVGISLGMWVIDAVAPREAGESVGDWFMALMFCTFSVIGAVVAARERSLRFGVVVALWAALISALLGFSVDLLATLQGWNFAGHMREYGGPIPSLDYFLTKHIAEHLSTSMRNLAAFPALAVSLGAIGAALGAAWRSWTTREGVLVR